VALIPRLGWVGHRADTKVPVADNYLLPVSEFEPQTFQPEAYSLCRQHRPGFSYPYKLTPSSDLSAILFVLYRWRGTWKILNHCTCGYYEYHSYTATSVVQWLACWPLETTFAISNPAEDVGFFRAKKPLSMPSLEWEVKASVPCRGFAAC
jgi:hypothetical protein